MKKKNKFKFKNILKLFFSIIVLILSIICFQYIFELNVIPDKYLILLGCLILLLNIIASLLLFIKGIISKIFSIILIVIIRSMSNCFINWYANY